jgi:DNA polymerase-1
MPSGTLIFDIESHSVDDMYTMPPEEFVRLIGYKWAGSAETIITESLEEIQEQILKARWIIGHNINSFDLPMIFGLRSNTPLELAEQGRVYDTFTHAALVHPAPFQYVDRHGVTRLANTPKAARRWFSLDNQAFQLGVPGKIMDLKELADEFGGYGLIPVSDKRYREYLIGDVTCSEQVAQSLLNKGPLDAYALREQGIEARKFIIQANGLRLDITAATKRRDELAARKAEILSELEERYGMPSEGNSPWKTDEGKRAVLAALADYGITPNTVEWPKTQSWANRKELKKKAQEKTEALAADIKKWDREIKSSELPPRSRAARERWIERDRKKILDLLANPLPVAFGLSLSGDTLIELTRDTPAEELGQAWAELQGQRSLSQLALDSVHSDGFVHPDIFMLQRSGRWSTTEPGLTVWTNSGPGAVEKDYFIADSEDEVLIEFDYSNADARIVAALSGDREYVKRFEPGADGHMINAIAAWGEDEVAKDPRGYRQKAKVPGHGWGYKIGPKTLARQTGMPEPEAKTFLTNMDKAFTGVVRWQKNSTDHARRHGYVVNDWGRKLWVEKGREFTQAPALLGQSGTREIICDALRRMPPHVLRRVKAQVHDALLMSIPKENADACRQYIVDLMHTSFEPKRGGQRLEFPADSGPAGRTWFEAIH